VKLLALNCNRCGAPLEVPEKAKFVTCTFCQTQLAVQHSGGSAYTEAIEKLDELTDRLSDDVAFLKLQGDLERLDREWSEAREGLMLRDKYGKEYIPNHKNANMVKLGLSIVGGLWIFFPLGFFLLSLPIQPSVSSGLLSFFLSLIFCAPGGLLIFLGGVFAKANLKKVKVYEEARDAYEVKRRALMAEMEELSA
jgi:LSD1 subclass zinc finger protein